MFTTAVSIIISSFAVCTIASIMVSLDKPETSDEILTAIYAEKAQF